MDIFRFFPLEIAFFVAGILTFRLYQSLHYRELLFKKFCWVSTMIVIEVTLFYQYIPTQSFKQWAYFVLLIISLPFIFELARNNVKDRRIGDFSYPIYISHIFVLAFAKIIFMPTLHIAPQNLGLVTAVLTVALSYILLKYIGDPIERFRHRTTLL